jgi:hypothetical protein
VKLAGLPSLNAKKLDATKLDATKTAAGKAAPGFESMLNAESRRPADEKKPRAVSSTDEALLVSRALTPHARPTPLIVTKPTELKVASASIVGQKAVTLDQLASRSKEQHAPQRVTGPTEKKRAAEEPKKTQEEPVLAAQVNTPPAAAAAAEPFRLEAPPAIKDAAPLAPVAPLMNEDPSLRVVLLPTIARMSMDTGDAGRINVELKVQNGITELRATGPAAQLLEARQGELRVALAKEGLALGHFDLTQSGQQQRGHGDRSEFELSAPPTARRLSTSHNDLATEDGRVHVKA